MATAIEGGTAYAMVMVEKRRAGKRFKDFTRRDWSNIAGEGGI